MKRKLTLAAVICTAMAVASGTALAQKSQTNTRKRNKEMTYTGCVQPGKQAGTYELTHVMAGKPGEAASSSQQGQAPEMIMLSSKSVKLAQMSGHKVTVMGTTRKQKTETTMRVSSAESLSGTCP
ncbi:MAG TPA: hypothetical protein VFY39_16550 [Gammaproteobacteria bacterium]|nr:hypothetical protein [Gammaproteobacteria bacterium]